MREHYNRREFLKHLSNGLCGVGMWRLISPSQAFALEEPHLKEVSFYKKLPDLKIQCEICPKKCEIADLERGYCGNK